MEPRFIQIHTLHSYPAALLNRDDSGLAKRIPFGGTMRGRISSQCLKRRWRSASGEWSLAGAGVPMGVRSREIVEREILKGHDLSDAKVRAVADVLLRNIYGENAGDPRKRQLVFLGQPEIAYLASHANAALSEPDVKRAARAIEAVFKNEKENMLALKDGAGLESALFGRMVTSDTRANREAAIHVAHAMTVHPIEREFDYMAVVDDLTSRKTGDGTGAGGLFDMELSCGLYYGYVVVDVPLLVANLSKDRDVAADVLKRLLWLIALESAGAKRGSTAPYTHAEFLLVEIGTRQPRTLANAFRDALPLGSTRLMDMTMERLATHLAQLDAIYGREEARRAFSMAAISIPGAEISDMRGIAEWAARSVREGSVA